jgi:hypothetical protein
MEWGITSLRAQRLGMRWQTECDAAFGMTAEFVKDIRFFHVASGFESGVMATALQDDKRFWEDFSVAQASRLHVCHNKPACEYLSPQTASPGQVLAPPEYC